MKFFNHYCQYIIIRPSQGEDLRGVNHILSGGGGFAEKKKGRNRQYKIVIILS